MFAPLILGLLAVYLIVGWVFIATVDRGAGRRRSGGALWLGVLFWPVMIVVDLVNRGGPNRG